MSISSGAAHQYKLNPSPGPGGRTSLPVKLSGTTTSPRPPPMQPASSHPLTNTSSQERSIASPSSSGTERPPSSYNVFSTLLFGSSEQRAEVLRCGRGPPVQQAMADGGGGGPSEAAVVGPTQLQMGGRGAALIGGPSGDGEQQELQTLRTQLSQKDAVIADLGGLIATHEEITGEGQARLAEAEARIASLQAEAAQAEARIVSLQAESAQAEVRIASLQAELGVSRAAEEAWKAEMPRRDARISSLQQQLADSLRAEEAWGNDMEAHIRQLQGELEAIGAVCGVEGQAAARDVEVTVARAREEGKAEAEAALSEAITQLRAELEQAKTELWDAERRDVADPATTADFGVAPRPRTSVASIDSSAGLLDEKAKLESMLASIDTELRRGEGGPPPPTTSAASESCSSLTDPVLASQRARIAELESVLTQNPSNAVPTDSCPESALEDSTLAEDSPDVVGPAPALPPERSSTTAPELSASPSTSTLCGALDGTATTAQRTSSITPTTPVATTTWTAPTPATLDEAWRELARQKESLAKEKSHLATERASLEAEKLVLFSTSAKGELEKVVVGEAAAELDGGGAGRGG